MEIMTTADLIQEVRDLSQEQNTTNPTDEAILRTLTRGQRFVVSELVRIYPEPLLVAFDPDPADVVAGAIPIPGDAFEDRVTYVEFVLDGSRPYRVPWRRYNQVAALRFSQAHVSVPYAVYTVGREIRFAGLPTGAYTCSVTYVRQPEPLVAPQGRITAIGADYLVIEPVNSPTLTTESDDLASYINIINHQTGEIRASFQIRSLPDSGNKINLRTPPQRTTVQGRAVLSATSLADCGAVEDDYVCLIKGTCVPMLGTAFNGYLVQYAMADISRSLDEAQSQLSGQIAEAYRNIAQQQDSGRDAPMRIKNTSKIWSRMNPFRFLPGSK